MKNGKLSLVVPSPIKKRLDPPMMCQNMAKAALLQEYRKIGILTFLPRVTDKI